MYIKKLFLSTLTLITVWTFLFSKDNNSNTTKNDTPLEKALSNSKTFNQNISSQTGVYFPLNHKKRYNKLSSSYFADKNSSDSNVGFGGIGFIEQNFTPTHYDNELENSPAFMLTIKKQGDSVKIGGDVKGLNQKNINEFILHKNE